jgi:hypothetical protein
LIFENSKKEIVQVDYTILVDFENSTDTAIKSSIGQLSFINTKFNVVSDL